MREAQSLDPSTRGQHFSSASKSWRNAYTVTSVYIYIYIYTVTQTQTSTYKFVYTYNIAVLKHIQHLVPTDQPSTSRHCMLRNDTKAYRTDLGPKKLGHEAITGIGRRTSRRGERGRSGCGNYISWSGDHGGSGCLCQTARRSIDTLRRLGCGHTFEQGRIGRLGGVFGMRCSASFIIALGNRKGKFRCRRIRSPGTIDRRCHGRAICFGLL